MISRYSHPEMQKIFDEQSKLIAWLRVERAVNDEWIKMKGIPHKEGTLLSKRLSSFIQDRSIDPKRVAEIEKSTRHDVLAFTSAVMELLGPEGRYLHFGLTSSDVVDTGLSLVLQEAGGLIRTEIQSLLSTLKKRSLEYKQLPAIGRTHGMFAEPTSFGLKFLGWYTEWSRNAVRWEEALEQIRFGKLSGAVGVSPHFEPEFEERCLDTLGLKAEEVSTQVIPRDRHAALMSVMAIAAGSLERVAVELRHLQRSEVAEVREEFQKGQKGSSAMPHKRNPISSENLTGCARVLRGYASAGFENIALWHERDISHSSVERIIIPDAFILLHYAIRRLNQILNQVVVDKDGVGRNLKNAGSIVYSGHFLLELVKAGASRDEAYRWIQSCAHEALDSGREFIELIENHEQIKKFLKREQIRKIGSPSYQLRHVGKIYDRIFTQIEKKQSNIKKQKKKS